MSGRTTRRKRICLAHGPNYVRPDSVCGACEREKRQAEQDAKNPRPE